LNSISLAPDGDLIASFRGCAQILKIDRPTGSVVWRLGGSVSDYLIVGDAFEEFCGQHTALEPSANVLLMFDNGGYCLGTRETDFGLFSRILEYQLDPIAGQAHFQRDHSLYGIYQEYTRSQGSVQLLQNGNWFVSWGNGPEMSVTEITEAGKEIFQMKIIFDGAIAVTYRAYRDAGVIVE
ncbi:MAG: arylsulfotransferase family protein, partial [Gammaproteobacteria bacterium]